MMELLKRLTLDDLKARYGTTRNLSQPQVHPSSVRVRILIPGGLRARVTGTRNYTVVIREEGNELIAACTCPYHLDHSEHCKHIVAVLLAWVREPDSFRPTPEWCRMLHGKTRNELLAIVMDLCETYPHVLEDYGLVELASAPPSGEPPLG